MDTSNAYLGFARKYRPKSLLELKGQEALVKVLSSSIINNRLAKGYLLTGIRGVGKTTSARIIAKTVNCTNLNVSGGEVLPCQTCQNCQSLGLDNHPDVIEIDAASRTGVDDIRQLIESSEYKPLLAEYKVFIIDEVHMLSKGAFNALLKILEEPPAHIIFILATTEVQKIPLTVISRCQRFDLKRLSRQELYGLLEHISTLEKLAFEKEALEIIAAKSEGSAREAVAMLDQVANLAISQNKEKALITSTLVNNLLGTAPTKVVLNILDGIIDHKAEEVIQILNNLYSSSVNLEEVFKALCDLLAYLCKGKVIKKFNDNAYLNYHELILNLNEKINFEELSILWQIISRGISEIKGSYNQIITAEMLVLKAIYSRQISDNLLNLNQSNNKIPNNLQSDLTEEEKENIKITPNPQPIKEPAIIESNINASPPPPRRV